MATVCNHLPISLHIRGTVPLFLQRKISCHHCPKHHMLGCPLPSSACGTLPLQSRNTVHGQSYYKLVTCMYTHVHAAPTHMYLRTYLLTAGLYTCFLLTSILTLTWYGLTTSCDTVLTNLLYTHVAGLVYRASVTHWSTRAIVWAMYIPLCWRRWPLGCPPSHRRAGGSHWDSTPGRLSRHSAPSVHAPCEAAFPGGATYVHIHSSIQWSYVHSTALT